MLSQADARKANPPVLGGALVRLACIEDPPQLGSPLRLAQRHPYPFVLMIKRPHMSSVNSLRSPGQLINSHRGNKQEVIMRFLKVSEEALDLWQRVTRDKE